MTQPLGTTLWYMYWKAAYTVLAHIPFSLSLGVEGLNHFASSINIGQYYIIPLNR